MSLDPHQVLGISPGASDAEIKRAYRTLAKAHHPDSAGARALPRFLEIQAAYEMLMSGKGRLPGVGPARRSQADPSRARATREAWRGRPRGTATAGGPSGPSAPRHGPTGTDRSAGGTEGTGSGRTEPGPAGTRGRRGSKKATLGSTSYDGATAEPLDPSWSGGAWYGQSSGTYWTLNPKEYADPRKHGPEYLARAKRPLRGARSAGSERARTEGQPMGEAEAQPADHARRPSGRATRPATGEAAAHRFGTRPPGPGPAGDHPTGAGPTAATARAGETWAGETSAGEAWAGETSAGERATRAGPSQADSPRDTPARDAPFMGPTRATTPGTPAPEGGYLDGLLAAILSRPRTPVGRLVLALVGWPPLGFAIASVAGETSGCSRFAATCPVDLAPILWLVQAGIFLVLVALPAIAGAAAVGTLAVLVAALPAAALVAVLGGSGSLAAGVLLATLAVVYAGGVALGIRRRGRRMTG